MLWGLFKKVVVADRLPIYVKHDLRQPRAHTPGSTIAVATVFFAFQIYCDFSGYSDIAIGAARVLGFELTNNFDRPYFSRRVARVLAPLAYLTLHLVQGLPLHPAGRQPGRTGELGLQRHGDFYGQRALARGSLELHNLGSIEGVYLCVSSRTRRFRGAALSATGSGLPASAAYRVANADHVRTHLRRVGVFPGSDLPAATGALGRSSAIMVRSSPEELRS